MIILKKRDIKKALKAGGKAGGSSYADIRTDIEATIDEAMTSTSPPCFCVTLKVILYAHGYRFISCRS